MGGRVGGTLPGRGCRPASQPASQPASRPHTRSGWMGRRKAQVEGKKQNKTEMEVGWSKHRSKKRKARGGGGAKAERGGRRHRWMTAAGTEEEQGAEGGRTRGSYLLDWGKQQAAGAVEPGLHLCGPPLQVYLAAQGGRHKVAGAIRRHPLHLPDAPPAAAVRLWWVGVGGSVGTRNSSDEQGSNKEAWAEGRMKGRLRAHQSTPDAGSGSDSTATPAPPASIQIHHTAHSPS